MELQDTLTEYVEKALKLYEEDNRIAQVTYYLDGWVANSYRYRAPGKCIRVIIDQHGATAKESSYDRKRAHGRGPQWVAMSAVGGRLQGGRNEH
jgi:hypothetical protein